jgi:hypothetical protein
VTLEGRAEQFFVSITEDRASVRRGDSSSGKQRSRPGIKTGEGVKLVTTGPNGFRIGILIDDPCTVYAFLGLLDRVRGSPRRSYTIHTQTGWT